MVRVLVALSAYLAFIIASHAATIQDVPYQGLQVITIFGDIEADDYKQFQQIAIPLDNAVVLLNSEGGSTYSAIEIGRTISIKGFSTFVGGQSTCASACGLIWLAGRMKLISSSARVGFHATYSMDNGKAETSGPGNALVGSYLRQLGFSDEAIIYMTSKSPNSMQWMTMSDAQTLGINAKVVQDTNTFGSSAAIQNQVEQQTAKRESDVAGANSSPPDLHFSALGPSQQKPEPSWSRLSNVDLPGHDLPDMPLSLDSALDCWVSCSRVSGCHAYTYNSQFKACFLKGGVGQALQYTGAMNRTGIAGGPNS